MKYNFEYTKNDYMTPPELYQMALDYFQIDKFCLDACCSEFNIPARIYYTQEGLFSGGWHQLSDNDGLTGEWFDFTWCNPPFNDCAKWVEKAYKENKEKGLNIAMLIPVRTETRFWHDYILYNPDVEIKWLRKCYTFIDPATKKPVQMKKKQKDGTYKLVNGVYKNALALVFFREF